jgi:DNA polymerase-3 subunit alpha
MYSTLDGLGKPEELILRAKELGQPAIAITDHGTTSGIYEFQKAGDKHDVKTILGTEFYLQHDSLPENKQGHLVVLAKNNNGLKTIYKLQELAYTENFYYKPRINLDMLNMYNEDIIVLSACLANPICQYLINNQYSEAKELALRFKRIFGDDFYLEIQPNNLVEQFHVNKELVKLYEETGIQLVTTNDVHYTYKEDGQLKKYNDEIEYSIHEVLLAIQVNNKMSDPKRFRFTTQDFWLKSEEEMKKELNYLPQYAVDMAINNTKIIADMCNARIEKRNYLPHYHTIPKGKTEEDILRELVTRNYNNKIIPNKKHNKEFYSDVVNELDVISKMGYPGYFLIVQDYVNYARNNPNIVVGDGRGSGAGSKVAYILGITNVNPQQYNLLFERFLTPGRVPDIDSDFSDIDAVFKYLQEQYGEDSVGRIITFGRLTAKNVTRRVFSVFGHSEQLISKINSSMPKRPSFTIDEALKESPDLRTYATQYKKEFEIIKRLEGLIAHTGQHAGGVVIWNKLSDVLPVVSTSEDRKKRIVAFDMDMLEELGHHKFDILGLQTLEVLQRTLDNIKKLNKIDIDLDNIDLEDENVYNMLCSGDILGVFQIEEQAHKVLEQQPRNFNDLIAINALIRPGVGNWQEYIERRKGKKYDLHPLRKPYLKETEGIITYQEQFMLDCKTFAGWSLAFADKYVRKNKNIRNDEELRKKFIHDGLTYKHAHSTLQDIWEEICDAVDGGYSFNKSHATSYALTAYKTAWLKYYYRKEFYASLLTQNGDDNKKVEDIIAECKKYNIKILPPDINISNNEFIATEEGIRYRLTTIRHVGVSAIRTIEALRPIHSLEDMLERGEKRILKKNVVENLIKAGTFDFQDTNRINLLNKFYQIREIDNELDPDTWGDKVKCQFEKESLDMYLSKHPIEKYHFKHITEFPQGDKAIIGGEIISVSEIYDKRGNKMAFVNISNQYGIVKAIVFSSIWNDKKLKMPSILKENNLVMLVGKRSGNDILVERSEILSW